jgi:hypothetical protein
MVTFNKCKLQILFLKQDLFTIKIPSKSILGIWDSIVGITKRVNFSKVDKIVQKNLE